MLKIIPFIFLSFLLSCSQINSDSKRYHEESKPRMRHGIVPVDTQAAVQLRPVNLEAVNRGREVYLQNCLDCHGIEGKGNGPIATKEGLIVPNLKAVLSEVPHFEFFISFSEWKGTMPGWRNPLTTKEREDLVEYLKSIIN
jgi:mono/diheme cytochrome c family protein